MKASDDKTTVPAEPDSGYRGLYRLSAIPSCSISMGDIRKLYRMANTKKHEVFDEQIEELEKPEGESEEAFTKWKEQLKQDRDLNVVVLGSNGEQIAMNSIEALSEDDLPNNISSIFFQSWFHPFAPNFKSINRFTLKIDFSKTANSFSYDLSAESTPNHSSLEVIGPKATWVTGVSEDILAFFKAKKLHRKWLHSVITFNIFHWFFAFPAAFWAIYRLDNVFNDRHILLPVVLRGAIYVYVTFVCLFGVRIVMGLVRWVFPLVELEGSRSTKVRILITTLAGALFASLVYDILKTLVN
jgi:hypothetical protein